MTEGPERDSHRVEAFALDLLKILHSVVKTMEKTMVYLVLLGEIIM